MKSVVNTSIGSGSLMDISSFSKPNPEISSFEVIIKSFFSKLNAKIEGISVDFIAELECLKQTTTVKMYYDEFKRIITSKMQLSSDYRLYCFIAGLQEEIQCKVDMSYPKTIHDAYYAALIHEFTIRESKNEVAHKVFDEMPKGNSNVNNFVKRPVGECNINKINGIASKVVKGVKKNENNIDMEESELEFKGMDEHVNVVEVGLIEHEKIVQPSNDLAVTKIIEWKPDLSTFEWKPGLKLWLNDLLKATQEKDKFVEKLEFKDIERQDNMSALENTMDKYVIGDLKYGISLQLTQLRSETLNDEGLNTINEDELKVKERAAGNLRFKIQDSEVIEVLELEVVKEHVDEDTRKVVNELAQKSVNLVKGLVFFTMSIEPRSKDIQQHSEYFWSLKPMVVFSYAILGIYTVLENPHEHLEGDLFKEYDWKLVTDSTKVFNNLCYYDLNIDIVVQNMAVGRKLQTNSKGEYNIRVSGLLWSSPHLFHLCSKRFLLKNVFMLSDQVKNRVEFVYCKSILSLGSMANSSLFYFLKTLGWSRSLFADDSEWNAAQSIITSEIFVAAIKQHLQLLVVDRDCWLFDDQALQWAIYWLSSIRYKYNCDEFYGRIKSVFPVQEMSRKEIEEIWNKWYFNKHYDTNLTPHEFSENHPKYNLVLENHKEKVNVFLFISDFLSKFTLLISVKTLQNLFISWEPFIFDLFVEKWLDLVRERKLDYELTHRNEVGTKSNAYWSWLIAHFQNSSVRKDIQCIKYLTMLFEVTTIEEVYMFYEQLQMADRSLYCCISIDGIQVRDELSRSLQEEEYVGVFRDVVFVGISQEFYKKLRSKYYGCMIALDDQVRCIADTNFLRNPFPSNNAGRVMVAFEINYADYFKSQLKLKLFNIHSTMFTNCGIKGMLIKNRNEIVKRWLVKWKWKWKDAIQFHDPWGQGSFQEEGIVICLNNSKGHLDISNSLGTSYVIFRILAIYFHCNDSTDYVE